MSLPMTPTVNCKTNTNTKTKTKTKTKCSKDPTYAMFSESRGFKDIKYDTHASSAHHQRIISASSVHLEHIISTSSAHHQRISASSVHHQRIINASSAHQQTRPDQDREGFNLANLILELAFLFLKSVHFNVQRKHWGSLANKHGVH